MILRTFSLSVSSGSLSGSFMIAQSREKLVIDATSPKRMVLSGPFWWRSWKERMEIFSTVPLILPMSMYSPTRKASSTR